MGACALDDDVGLRGRLPLALEITAAVLSTHPALDLDKLIGEPDADRDQLDALCGVDGPNLGESSVRAALELAHRGLSTHAARIFRLLPVNPGPDASTDAIAALAGQPADEVDVALIDLTRACLLEPTSGRGARWRMNELVRRYAQDLSEAPAEATYREQGRDRLLDFYLAMTAAADDHLRLLPGMRPPGEFTSQNDALAWLDAERDNLIAAVQMAADTGRDQAAVSLPLLLAQYFAHRRDFADLRATTLVSLATARRLGDEDAEGDALTNLGDALMEMYQFEEAVTAHQDAAGIFRGTGDRCGEGDALNNLGVALTAFGRPDEAVTAHQRAATIFRETGDRHREGTALNNLGLALTVQGRPDEAVTAHQRAATIFRETGDRHREDKALNNLGEVVHEAGG